jgi:hypothetical protein
LNTHGATIVFNEIQKYLENHKEVSNYLDNWTNLN